MKHKLGKPIASLLILLAMLFSLNTAAFAANEVVDLSAVGSVSVTPKANGQAVGAGMTFTLYRVGKGNAAQDGTLSYVLTDAFSGSKADLTKLEASGLAQTLADYAAAQNVSGTAKKAGGNGTVKFDGLAVGVYLLVQTSDGGTGYTVQPFLATVPLTEDGRLNYNVDASPKTEVTGTTDITVKKIWNDGGDTSGRPGSISVTLYRGDTAVETVTLRESSAWSHTWTGLPKSDAYSVKEDTVSGYQASYSQSGTTFTITNTPSLVQTGQLNWPIPVLAGCGVALFAVGWALVFLKRKNNKAE